eukprot:CAMPEP_0168344898 /NCGR_PEP_ID=MMETSP0213-20121227/17155_1 /TAXON_ID=151035 /ORGANISM="Euplotes harpa, Strain FSP1.4" /LENGTH=115 /DNA_ID=CAMNT_0008352857 /DNA_START=209 /DNA_END=553 /DNA_ORIENTATION=-
MAKRNTMVTSTLVFANILFSCLSGPCRKNEPASDHRTPKVYGIANLAGLPFAIARTTPNDSKLNMNPRMMQTAKPISLCFNVNDGHQESFAVFLLMASSPIAVTSPARKASVKLL